MKCEYECGWQKKKKNEIETIKLLLIFGLIFFFSFGCLTSSFVFWCQNRGWIWFDNW